MKKSLWLHNIRSAYNVGSMFRTADAVGIEHIYLSGYTPLPVDRFGRARIDINKVAIGAEKTVEWSHLDTPEEHIKTLKDTGTKLVAVEQNEKSISVFNYKTPKDVSEIIIVMGEETLGMEKWQLNLCDDIVEIPMSGKKESLNVSVAFGVVAYQVFK